MLAGRTVRTGGFIRERDFETLTAISQRFGGAATPPSWREFFAEHVAGSARTAIEPFDREIARTMARRFIVEPEIEDAVLAQIDAILDDQALRVAAVIASYFLFDAGDVEADPGRNLIAPTDSVCPKARLFYVPLFLARIPALLDAHARLGIAAVDTNDLLSDIERWIVDYRSRHGVIGFENARWLSNHFRMRLFQFGRLQFEPCEFDLPFRVFERVGGAEYLALVESGHEFRPDGQFRDADRGSSFPPRSREDTKVAGTTSLTITTDRIIGNPVDERGGILAEPVVLGRAEWNELIGPGSRVVAVHIPASGPLEPKSVSNSFERAADYFSRTSPEYVPRMFTCDSWLMDRQLDRYLGPASNIIDFQRRFLPLPLPGASDHQHFERVFGTAPARIDDAPQESRVQKALVEHVRRGRAWRTAGGVAPLPLRL